MSLLSLRLSNNFDSYISGEVTIHPSAVLAPGVILQAAENSKIVIGAGVCIGLGAILQVHEGTLEVEAGANLGAGFLMVGKGKIGANACIGSATTIFNYSVEPGQVVAPGSILGDTSRQIAQTNQPEPSANNVTATSTPPQKEEENSSGGVKEKVTSSTNFSAAAFVDFKQNKSISYFKSSATPESQPPPVEEPAKDAEPPLPEPIQESIKHDSDPNQLTTESANGFGTQIYGQGSISRLLTTLFPHRQSLRDPNSDD
ncbi:transferase [Nostoc sp. 'Peltigera membranacea cyanobiont' 213]|uniref:transferase n=1 Tax=unclassified Nostoc TaxID=2593658 RepID=UPI000B958263|nr:transferase [Nostoc sp. 'Peltigera membranacea cyanobiont' 213]OYD99225.1 transferase [Nostoc sp. 'Peltigera membranacea cyanobiont' 213]